MEYWEEKENAFNELVHWKRNLFDLPKGVPGKAFINELTKHINKWSSKSPNWEICLKSLMVMPSLILQRTSNKCKMSQIKSHVEKSLNLWENKGVEGLLNKTRTIQKSFPQRQKPQTTEEKVKILAKLVLEGKVNAANWLLDDGTTRGVLPLSVDVMKTLRQKHPNAKPSNDTMMLQGPFNQLKVRMNFQDWMPISGVKSNVTQPLATHQTISVML